MSLPHNFKRITLHLARTKEHPAGSDRHGYDIVAPVDASGHIDLAEWKKHKEACRVRRFWGMDEEVGQLRHRAGGAGGSTWFIDYDASRDDDDEAGYRLGDHVMRPGEYVSIRHDDEMHTFQIIAVENAG